MSIIYPEYSLSVAEISLASLGRNLEALKSVAPQVTPMAIVKANAYGHGVEEIVKVLVKLGVEYFGVATLDEGIQLRKLGLSKKVLVLASPLECHLRIYHEYDLDLCLGSTHLIEAICGFRKKLDLHVQIDTGMSRLGISPDLFSKTINELRKTRHELTGVMSHFTSADEDAEFTDMQHDIFQGVLEGHRSDFQFVHIANTAGAMRLGSELGNRAMMRLGIGLFGYGVPSEYSEIELEPVMTLSSRIIATRRVKAGETVSYGRTWFSPTETNIATVAIGYADGYPRSYSNWAQVRIGKRLYPVVGVVCMDMIMVDIGNEIEDIEIGDRVILFGKGGPSADELSKIDASIPYELITGISSRVKKMFITED